ncbi:MAG TPA: tetratricopeptide repeat protein [Bacteroidia bacterium]|nr:tetratricopeptide repeat protein [Bacteroidia bacterium]
MKRIVSLIILSFLFCFNSVYSQKSKVRAAYNFYKDPYNEYGKAKDAIDEAIGNEQSKGMAEAWYYRGLIYSAINSSETYKNLCDHCLETAVESFQKANELDPKNQWADEITTFRIPQLKQIVFSKGVGSFNAGKYQDALNEFEYVLKLSPGDTTVTLNSALSAENAGNKEKAKVYYNQLIGMQYNDDHIYLSLSNIYLQDKDTANALKVIREARKQFPDTLRILLSEINLMLATNQQKEAIGSMEAALVKDPQNQNLYLALGNAYDNLGHPKDEKGNELPRTATMEDYSRKAEDMYKKGLAVNPNSFELNFNLGAYYFNQASEMENKANALKSVAEYDKAKIEFDKKYKDSEPFLEKALEVNPNDSGTLSSLKLLYFRTKETEKYDMVKARLDNLK